MIRACLLGSRGVPAKYGAFEFAADRIAHLGGLKNIRWLIYCPSSKDKLTKFGNADIVHIPHGRNASASFFYDLFCLVHASFVIRPKVIVMLGYGAGPCLLIPRLFRIKLITNTNGFEYKRAKWKWWIKIYFKFCEKCAVIFSNQLISDSINVSNYYSKKYNKKSHFIAYGTDVPEMSDLDDSQSAYNNFITRYDLKSKKYHVVVMRMEPENSIEQIILSFLNGSHKYPVVLIGPSTPFFDNLKIKYDLSTRNVLYVGPIYDRSLLFLIRFNSLSYIHGHTVGGINPTILEALSTDNPIIASLSPYNYEVLRENGLYFFDEDSLSRCVHIVESYDKNSLSKMSGKVKDCNNKNFTWEFVVEKYEELITTTL